MKVGLAPEHNSNSQSVSHKTRRREMKMTGQCHVRHKTHRVRQQDRGAIALCNSSGRCRPSEVLSVPQAMTWYQLANNERVGEEIE